MRVSLRVLAVAIVAVAFTASVFAQAKPNFAGKWVMDPASAPAPPPGGAPGGGGGGGGRGGGGRGGGGGPFGQEFTATQDAATLTITRMQGDQTVTSIFKLDGSESKNMVAGRGGQTEQVSKAVWEGNKLAITTAGPFGEQKRVLSLEGGNLVVEQTVAGRDGGAPTTTKLVFKKG